MLTREDKTTEEIIAELKRGQRLELNYRLLFERHYDQVYRFFQRKGIFSEDCRDLTQDVFISVYKGLHGLREEAQFLNWLFTIARNIYRNELQRRKAQKRDGREVSSDQGLGEHELAGEQPPHIAEPMASPMEALLEKEKREKFSAALEDLPTQMRRCVHLRVNKGFTNSDIAALMGISVNTVKAHVHQARKALRERLGEYVGDIDG